MSDNQPIAGQPRVRKGWSNGASLALVMAVWCMVQLPWGCSANESWPGTSHMYATSDADIDADTGTDVDGDADTDAEADSDTDADTDVDSHGDGDVETEMRTCSGGQHWCQALGGCVTDDSVEHCGNWCTSCPDVASATATCDGTSCGFVCDSGYFPCLGRCLPDSEAPCDFSASPLGQLAASMKAGTFAELEIDGPVSNCDAFVPPSGSGTILEFTDEALWNPISREIYIMGTARPYGVDDQQFIKYSESTNSWTILNTPDEFHTGYHGYDHGAMDPSTGDYYRARTGQPQNIWRLDYTTKEWEKLPNVPVTAVDQIVGFDFFPEMGGVIWLNARNGGERFVYTRSSNRWRRAALGVPFGGLHSFSEYNAVHNVMLFGGGNNFNDKTPQVDEGVRLYRLDEEGVVTRLADAPVRLGEFGSGPVQTIDPVSGKMLVFPGDPDDTHVCPSPIPFYEYDLKTDTWSQAGVHQLMAYWCGMFTAAVPLYDHGVVFLANFRGDGRCSVFLYKHSVD